MASNRVPRRLRAALAVASFVLVVVFRDVIVVDWDFSLVYLAPLALAAAWYGRWVAAAAGLALALVFPTQAEHAAVWIRALVYGACAWALGWLFEQRGRMRGELEELRVVQEALTPAEVPAQPGLRIATVYAPAEHGVAGDFFLVGAGRGGVNAVIVGDVLGKGVEAARLAAFVRTSLAGFLPYSDDPAELLELANRAVFERARREEQFVTVACLIHDARRAEVSWSVAGHPPPVRLDSGELLVASRPGFPLGMQETAECPRERVALPSGQGLLLYTDGLPEARRDGTWFGYDSITAEVRRHPSAEPERIVHELLAAGRRYSSGAMHDDVCLVAVRAT